jgi:hypothetical protein
MTKLDGADAFLAEGPDPALADKLQLFGQWIGSWDVVVTNHRPDGSSETIPAEWHFAWALGGRAIQDVWIAPSRAERVSGAVSAREGEWGATLRFYDEAIDAWRSTWIGPRRGVVMPFLARSVGDEIVLEGSFEEGVRTRWIFSGITPDSFSWRAVDSNDDDASVTLLQEMKARRRIAVASPIVAVPRTMEAIRLHAPGVSGLRHETIGAPSLQLGRLRRSRERAHSAPMR